MRSIGIFAKHWRPGFVKTRLAADIGDEAAAHLHYLFLECLAARFGEAGKRRVIYYAPDEAASEFEEFRWLGWELAPQGGGDLGDRMKRFFQSEFARGASQVVLIGSDSPTLPLEQVDQAFAALQRDSAVFTPAEDGGYCLVGASGEPPPIFDGMAWSSPQLWRQTIDRLDQAECSYTVLDVWSDVDDLADLRKLNEELTHSSDSALAIVRLHAYVGELLASFDDNTPCE